MNADGSGVVQLSDNPAMDREPSPSGQGNADNDPQGNACDSDDDNDGILNTGRQLLARTEQ